MEISFEAGFSPNPENNNNLEAYIRLHFKLRLFGQKMIFDYEWTGELDKLIAVIVKYVLKYIKMHLVKHFKEGALLITESFDKVKNFFNRKKNKQLTE